MSVKSIRFLTRLGLGVLSISALMYSSPRAQAETYSISTESAVNRQILKMEIEGIPGFLARKTFKSYIEAYTAIKKNPVSDSSAELRAARAEMIRIMENDVVQIKGEGFNLFCSGNDYGAGQLTLHGDDGETVCFRIEGSDRGGHYRKFPFFPDMRFTPLTFSEMDGKVSWFLVEYLLDRNTRLDPTTTFSIARNWVRSGSRKTRANRYR